MKFLFYQENKEGRNMLENIKGRHLVFIIGFISVIITSIWSPGVATDILFLLILMGFWIFIKSLFIEE